tara:strand:- start:42 stop:209 length:168 start_codon:yes stop_codon:yes gene_type:complete
VNKKVLKWLMKEVLEQVTTQVSKDELEQMRQIADVPKNVDSSNILREFITQTLKK